MSWQHIRPDTQTWTQPSAGVWEKRLSDHPFPVRLVRLDPLCQVFFSGLALIAEGSGEQQCGRPVKRGDLLWRASSSSFTAGPAGLGWYTLDLPAALRPSQSEITIGADERPWQDFADPAGRPTQPVQVLLDGKLSALRTRFAPTFVAAEHWHDFDTLYFITHGDMQFGFEGQYYAGEIRQVTGGFSYGPERPGPEGVEFVLFSCGGPVNLHWSDLHPAPRGGLVP